MDYHIGEDNILDISFDHILLQWSLDSLIFVGGIMEWDFFLGRGRIKLDAKSIIILLIVHSWCLVWVGSLMTPEEILEWKNTCAGGLESRFPFLICWLWGRGYTHQPNSRVYTLCTC